MLDIALRPTKDRLLAGTVAVIAPRVAPGVLTAGSLVVTLAAAGAAWAGWPVAALFGWLVGRVLDGLDGPVARHRGSASDLGGYLDTMADTVGYVALPLGVAAGIDRPSGWVTVAVLMGSFWLNGMSWAYLAAILEKRGAGAAATGESTTVTMRPALIEGTETIVLFSVFTALPAIAPWVFAAMAAGVAVGIAQRVLWAARHLA